MSEERLKIAVFIDFDNIEIGVKTTLGTSFDVGTVLEAVKERGEVVTKSAYGDWTRAGDYGRAMSQHAVHMVQRNLTPGGDKNGADINLALDALEMAFTHNHINAFVIVGGDSDFISLVEKLKQYDRKVFVVGGRAFTSMVMQKNCTEFIAYENLTRRGGGRSGRPVPETELSRAMPLVRRALKVLADREVVPQLGLLKSTLLQLDSAFSEREYGASSFRDFVQKLAKGGFVALKGSDRSFHVELRDGRDPETAPTTEVAPVVPTPPAAAPADPGATRSAAPPAPSSTSTPGDAEDASVDDATPRPAAAEGVSIIHQAFAQATIQRWPLYVRQVKQVIRTFDERFDERRFGFGGIIDALRHCQREGIFRLDRDRQGVVRIYPGVLLQRADATGEPGGTMPVGETPPTPELDVIDQPADEQTTAPTLGGPEPRPVDEPAPSPETAAAVTTDSGAPVAKTEAGTTPPAPGSPDGGVAAPADQKQKSPSRARGTRQPKAPGPARDATKAPRSPRTASATAKPTRGTPAPAKSKVQTEKAPAEKAPKAAPGRTRSRTARTKATSDA